jgi:hypothetical protein
MLKKAQDTAMKLATAANIPMQAPQTTKEWQRIVLWSFWAVNMLIDIIYIGLSFATSSRLSSHISTSVTLDADTWRAPIAATVLGPLMVFAFNILSCVILVRKSINATGPSFGYGFIMAWSFMMAFYMLLCGLVLDSFSTSALTSDPNGSSGWTQYYSDVYQGTVVFNYICASMFILFFLGFVVFQGGISKHLQLYDAKTDNKRQMELAAIARAAQMNNMNPLAGTPGVMTASGMSTGL